ncbi:DUF7472 family protein [Halosegnis longus]|uniref:Uncharacterized protein n=1 Tax=Halosegnis longus TaxID=2216012 RepID=A0AAJ4R744_9EURY|nr:MULTISPECIES: hypothetical protein [Halobacteriales]RNJ25382.1 hypothetical protein Nmn1133_00840 [Salella cibi]
MELDRETVVEAGVSTVAVILFVAALVGVGSANGRADLTAVGGKGMLAVLFGFILLMTVIGVFLDRR